MKTYYGWNSEIPPQRLDFSKIEEASFEDINLRLFKDPQYPELSAYAIADSTIARAVTEPRHYTYMWWETKEAAKKGMISHMKILADIIQKQAYRLEHK